MEEDEQHRILEELQALKQAYGSRLKVTKAKGKEALFPITVKLDISAPLELAMYDISGFQVVLTISSYAYTDNSGMAVSISEGELPEAVRKQMATILQGVYISQWKKFSGEQNLQLSSLLDYARKHFKDLVTCIPELVEAYESVDANGASARRYMLNDPKSHIEVETTTNSQSEVPTAPQLPSWVETDSQLESELKYLQRRFRSAFCINSDSPGDQLLFKVMISPTDPTWPKKQQLKLQGSIMQNFPQEGSLTLQAMPSREIGQELCTILDKILKAEAQTALERQARQNGNSRGSHLVGDVLRNVENNAGQYLSLAEDVVSQSKHPLQVSKNQPATAGNAIEVDLDQADLSESCEENPESLSAGSATETGYTTEEGDLSGEEVNTKSVPDNTLAALKGASLHLELEDLKLDNVDAMDPLQLNLQVSCERCASQWDCQLASSAVSADALSLEGTCSTCSSPWSLQSRLLLAHAYNKVVAHLKHAGCKPIDLTPSIFACQCGYCSSLAVFRDVQIGKTKERNCTSCHLHMSVSFSSVQFWPFQQEQQQSRKQGASQTAKSASNASAAEHKQLQLIPGTPLPAKGTCKHYPHSYRLLRFPCCGRRYPCDVCHEEDTDGHDMKWAMRHVCGFCSTEQKIAERCCNCNKRLTFNAGGALGSQTRHWEGGQGCRDKKRLDRRDRAKYRNTKAKSVSKKAFRVGEEGARRRK